MTAGRIAMQVPRFGGPEVFEAVPAEVRAPGAGEVAIQVEAVGINFADIMARMGLYPDSGKPPFVPGFDYAGRVEELGAGTTGLTVGQEVMGLVPAGAYSERIVVPASLAFGRPSVLDAVAAAATPTVYLTAWYALVYIGNLHPGERILVHNAGGGLGTAAVQVAKHCGAVVIGTASTRKQEVLRDLGVDHPIDYSRGGWREEVLDLTDGEGVEMILDPIGGRNLADSFETLAHTGRLIAVGISSWAPGMRRGLVRAALAYLRTPRLSPTRMMVKNRTVIGVHVGHLAHKTATLAAEFRKVLELLEQGVLAPVVDRTFPIREVSAAHRFIQERRNVGKVVLTAGLD